MHSNCFAHAARWFAAGPNGYLLLRLSRLAGWQWHAPRPVWALAGLALYWPAVALLNLWALACTDRTLHAAYAEHQTGRCRPRPDAPGRVTILET